MHESTKKGSSEDQSDADSLSKLEGLLERRSEADNVFDRLENSIDNFELELSMRLNPNEDFQSTANGFCNLTHN